MRYASITEYSEFWEPIRREGLFAGKPVPVRDEYHIMKTVHGVQLFLTLNNNSCFIKLAFRWKNKSECRDKISERRDEIMELFPELEYNYEYTESPKFALVRFPVIDKGKKDRDDWPEIREKLLNMGTDIYNRIDASDTWCF